MLHLKSYGHHFFVLFIVCFMPEKCRFVTKKHFAISCTGVIYLKNMLTQYWVEREPEHVTDIIPFNIHEQDRQPIRDNIIEAVIHAPDPVR